MFTKAEKKPFYDSKKYRLLADYANYCEVVSLKSGHFWRLRVEEGEMVLYHKYTKGSGYHVQCRPATVQSAEKKIMKHDSYVRKYARWKIMRQNL